MICDTCDNKDFCKYRDDTTSFERNFNKNVPTNLENLKITLVCKYNSAYGYRKLQTNTITSDSISGYDRIGHVYTLNNKE